MSDFKWEMQERIDQGMNPDQAYAATREAYLDAADLQRKTTKENLSQEPEKHPADTVDLPHGS